jgi:hypothetical protein
VLVSKKIILKVEDVLEQLSIPRERFEAWNEERRRLANSHQASDGPHSIYYSTEPAFSLVKDGIPRLV